MSALEPRWARRAPGAGAGSPTGAAAGAGASALEPRHAWRVPGAGAGSPTGAQRLLVGLLAAGCVAGCANRQLPGVEADVSLYAPAASCEICHRKIYVQHRFSMHNVAFTDPVFRAQLYDKLVPAAAAGDERLQREAQSCLGCHSPITWLQAGKKLVPQDEVRRELSGVTCDFCHTVTGFTGDLPGNANYTVRPGETKLGPFKNESDWHHTYAELQTKSEFCAMCHSRSNTLGVQMLTTYDEWKGSDYAKRGVQCQDCHMNAKGFLVDGQASYESGQAAMMTTGNAKERAKLFSHRFPGAHAAAQVKGAMELTIKETHQRLTPGQKVTVEVVVNNSRAGHKMPTGSAELRVLWLEVRVGLSDETTDELLPARPGAAKQPLDVAGASSWDEAILGSDVPAGARLYRAVFTDAAGTQTMDNYLAAKKVFDNRLLPGELRTERFEYTVPAELKDGDDLHVVASLQYLSAPAAFYQRLGMAPRQPTEMAADTGRLGTPADEGELRLPRPPPPLR